MEDPRKRRRFSRAEKVLAFRESGGYSVRMKRWMPAAACLALLVATHADADDGGVDIGGGGARLMEERPDISMSDEYVRIDMLPDHYRVRATFHFFNHGVSTAVAVGFPVDGSAPEGVVVKRDFPRFKTWVNGKLAETRDVPNADFKDSEREFAFFKVKQIEFPAASTTTSVVDYEAPYGYSSNGERSVYYPYGTGRSWSGPIGKAIFDVRFDENILGVDITLSNRAHLANRSRGQIVFELDSVKPNKFAEANGANRHREGIIRGVNGIKAEKHAVGPDLRYAGLRVAFFSLDLCLMKRADGDDRDYCPLLSKSDTDESSSVVFPDDDEYRYPSYPARYPTLIYYRLKRNAIYASGGYSFHDPLMKSFFSARSWYAPDPSYTAAGTVAEERAGEYKWKEDAIIAAPHYKLLTEGFSDQ